MKDKIIYLASPYSHRDPKVRELRFKAVCFKVVEFLKKDTICFSPIAMFHPIAKLHPTLGLDFCYWQDVNYNFLKRCDELYVYRLPGWEESIGVTQEIRWARKLGLTIYYANPTVRVQEAVIKDNRSIWAATTEDEVS